MTNLEPAGLDALIKHCEYLGLDATEILRRAAIDRLKGVERAPIVHASWFDQFGPGRCSRCGFPKKLLKISCDYCPQCGARMDGGESDG